MRNLVWFKGLIFALIGINALVFSVRGTAAEIIDTLAWLTLLTLFEIETVHPHLLQGVRALRYTHIARLLAGAAVCIAAAGYVIDRAWIDAANIALWIAVVILLEFELRYPRVVASRRQAFVIIAALLYGGLATMVMAWAWRGEWFDAYDAVLWLIAFLVIEMNLLRPPVPARQAPC